MLPGGHAQHPESMLPAGLLVRLLPDPESPTGQVCGRDSPRGLMIHHQQISGHALPQQVTTGPPGRVRLAQYPVDPTAFSWGKGVV